MMHQSYMLAQTGFPLFIYLGMGAAALVAGGIAKWRSRG